jgi:hypothetical protein
MGLVDDKWQGYMRKWCVFDYDTDIKGKCGWGMNTTNKRAIICYNRGRLGVAIITPTGETRVVNTLRAYKSMYAELTD